MTFRHAPDALAGLIAEHEKEELLRYIAI